MKSSILTSVILLAFTSSHAMAACPTTGLTGTQLVSLVSGKYACATRGGDKWDELHQGTGFGPSNVEDYKLGPTDPVDPTKVVGTYTISNGQSPDTISYNYGDPGGPYRYVVIKSPNPNPLDTTYFFCNVATSEVFVVLILPAHC